MIRFFTRNFYGFFCAALLLLNMMGLTAQEKDSSIDMGVDVMSRYVWRGMNLSNSPVIQPHLDYITGNFNVGAWGSYSFANEPNQEVDVYVGYQLPYVTIGLSDYFVTNDSLFSVNNYFDWSKASTSHALEAILTIADIPGIPLSLTTGVFIYGNDLNEDGKNYYSTYMELGYDFSIREIDLQAFAAVSPFEGMYADDFSLVNVGLSAEKEIPITDTFSLPLQMSFVVNPDMENVFFVVGFSL